VVGIDGELDELRLGVRPGIDDIEEVGVLEELGTVWGGDASLVEEVELAAEDCVETSFR
jgi:hypothetical protein